MRIAILAALGLGGFTCSFVFDWLTARRPGPSRTIFWLCGILLLAGSAIALLVLEADRDALATTRGGVFLALAAVCAFLVCYSLFIELPRGTYAGDGIRRKVVDRGTWALCRHPGVLWFGLGACFASIAAASPGVWIAMGLWTAANVLYATAQERLFFTVQFEDYDRYRASTPMFIPTRASLSRCLATLGNGKRRRPAGAVTARSRPVRPGNPVRDVPPGRKDRSRRRDSSR